MRKERCLELKHKHKQIFLTAARYEISHLSGKDIEAAGASPSQGTIDD